MESLPSYLKMPENLPKIYEDYPNVSEDPPIIYGTLSQDIIRHAQPLLFPKAENLPWKNCHFCALLNPLLLCVQITRLHITYFLGVCEIIMAARTHTSQYKGVRNWSVGVSEREIEVFDSQA